MANLSAGCGEHLAKGAGRISGRASRLKIGNNNQIKIVDVFAGPENEDSTHQSSHLTFFLHLIDSNHILAGEWEASMGSLFMASGTRPPASTLKTTFSLSFNSLSSSYQMTIK